MKEFAPLGSKFFPISDTVNTVKIKNENNFFFDLSEGMENCKMSGKNQGKSENFEVDDKWQP